ncbi:MAG: methyltransferase domain-containing protein [Ruminococcaceae bacterium]|nr:methyltransferase domain-containing protein [Oscillospiraceae bacterium]
MSILVCPFCGVALARDGASYFCGGAKRHCFDIAKSGYVSLTRASGTSGDDRDMVRARTAFLEEGYYAPFADAVADAAKGCAVIVDAGCGEGYYTNRLASDGAQVYGFDLSKYACDHGAKCAKRAENGAFFGVASVFELPIADESADAVVSLFAPIAEKEFSRILEPGGRLIVGAAGRRHLYELKQAIYAEAYENEGRRDLPEGFALLSQENVTYTFDCAGEHLRPLFSMTPYAFKTSISDAAKLDALERLTITADFDIFIYEKRR